MRAEKPLIKKEKSCGAVVYKQEGGKRLYLIEHMALGHTSIPKGHVEGDETETETALREIREETNLDAEIDTGFRHVITYSPFPGIIKDVVFFTAEAVTDTLINQESEVSGLEWMELDDALRALTHDSDKEVLASAAEYLDQRLTSEAHRFSRTERLIGKEAMKRLQSARVAVFGVGGVGGYVCEALARSGIGAFDLIDKDTVSITNINRQIIALSSTIGKPKVDVMKERMLDINPDVQIRAHNCFFLPENSDGFPFESYDYVVDAVDTVTAKIELIMKCKEKGIPVISSMGAGNKMDPCGFRIADISETKVCPWQK